MIIFKPENHQYVSTEKEEAIDWISVTTLLGFLKQPFDAKVQAGKSSRSKTSKWYGMKTEEILSTWKAESERALKLGSSYHNQQEAILCSQQYVVRLGKQIPVIKPLYDAEGNKMAPVQKLVEGIYPEHLMYLKSVGICGQSDLVEVIDGSVHITDYKTNKEIKSEGFTNWEGITQKMHFPVSHLDDCNLNHYHLQLSVYLYIILKHNPRLRAGKLIIHHVQFEEEGTDKFGYPITRLDRNDQPILKKVIPYELPYLRDEVVSIIHWLHENREKLRRKKVA